MKIRTSILLLFLSLVATYSMASPARQVKRILTLEDGSKVEATLTGDEYCHWYVDENGKALILDSISIAHYITDEALSKRQNRGIKRAKDINNARAKAKGTQVPNSFTGTKKGLVILINFKDVTFSHSRDDINDMVNKNGYNLNGSIGSVKDYFIDQSYGQFEIDFDVVGPYTLSHNMEYYGQNDKDGDDMLPGTMITEACQLADADVDFADYDWDGDGKVDQVYVQYAGYSEEQGGSVNCIWAHEWSLTQAYEWNSTDGQGPVVLDGVIIDTYACSGELYGSKGTKLSGIGTICHEFSHCLGLYDVYDYNRKGFGMGKWSIMDLGNYCNDGYIPAGYTSYERWVAGWLTPIELTNDCNVTGMKCLTDSPEAYIIYNDANNDEYYLLENRQNDLWDQGLGGHGMLVVHVDYNAEIWEKNTINEIVSHQRMTIIAADTNYSLDTMSGDPYPGTNNNTELTNTSIPISSLYNKNIDGQKLMSKPITNISEDNDGLISFTFSNSNSTGINEMENPVTTNASKKIFSITGQYLGTNKNIVPKGFYIRNGKKFVTK